ncbi:hypothetical protein RvY_05158 [Ramazzottius varieornatus]|uniref:Uncharacterized protein n=1 Tax=Ramazzottius varieornatus TaxID=947166 RepID=A0A1D1UX50_RAMVA|nr:hypothetical protein RvY_05158 [Ramazzottius varieornatus]
MRSAFASVRKADLSRSVAGPSVNKDCKNFQSHHKRSPDKKIHLPFGPIPRVRLVTSATAPKPSPAAKPPNVASLHVSPIGDCEVLETEDVHFLTYRAVLEAGTLRSRDFAPSYNQEVLLERAIRRNEAC